MRPSTSRTFPADARAMARNPAGWNPSMLAPNAATASGAGPRGSSAAAPCDLRGASTATADHDAGGPAPGDLFGDRNQGAR